VTQFNPYKPTERSMLTLDTVINALRTTHMTPRAEEIHFEFQNCQIQYDTGVENDILNVGLQSQ
jgi:hypothetical protein